MTIVLHGYYSENATAVLRPLLELAGHTVLELNEHSGPHQIDAALGQIAAGCTVITSCHFFCSGAEFQRIYPELPTPLTPLDFLGVKHADTKIMFLAHDLAEPIKDEEWPLAGIFDKIFLPRPLCLPHPLRQVSPLTIWYKDLLPSATITPIDRIFLPTNVFFELRALGLEGYLDRYKDILDAGFPWKLAVWAGFDPLLSALRDCGCVVLPSETSARDAIAVARDVVTNHVGSVVWESIRLGKPCFIFKEAFLDMLHVSRLLTGTCGVCILREITDLSAAGVMPNLDQTQITTPACDPEQLFEELLAAITAVSPS
jgi:hypothetical protein